MGYVLIIFVAALVQGMSGFGFSLIAIPFLTLIMPLQIIVPILVICSLVLNLVIFTRMQGNLHLKAIAVMLVVGIMSTPLGVQILTVVDETILKAMVGLLIILSALIMYRGYKLHLKNIHVMYGLTGLISGVLNGSLSLSGPPVVLMLVNEGQEKNVFKKNISAYFLALNLFTIPSFLGKGLITVQVLKMSTLGVVILLAGATLGIKLGDKIDENRFKKMVLVMIMSMGLMTLVSIF